MPAEVKEIRVSEVVGTILVGYPEAEVLYLLLSAQFTDNGCILELDFEGVSLVSSPFFNGSVSMLVVEFGLPIVQSRLVFLNLPDYARDLLNESIHNCVEQMESSGKVVGMS